MVSWSTCVIRHMPSNIALGTAYVLSHNTLPVCRSSGKRTVKICGVQRIAVVAVVLSFGLLLLWYSAAHITVLWALLTGVAYASCM